MDGTGWVNARCHWAPGGDGMRVGVDAGYRRRLFAAPGWFWLVVGERAIYVSVSLAGIDHRVLHLGGRLVGQRMGVVNGGQRRYSDFNRIQRPPVTSAFLRFRWSTD